MIRLVPTCSQCFGERIKQLEALNRELADTLQKYQHFIARSNDNAGRDVADLLTRSKEVLK